MNLNQENATCDIDCECYTLNMTPVDEYGDFACPRGRQSFPTVREIIKMYETPIEQPDYIIGTSPSDSCAEFSTEEQIVLVDEDTLDMFK